jgi:hypothetical protein
LPGPEWSASGYEPYRVEKIVAQKDILGMNAALKYIEFVLGAVDNADDSMTVEHIRFAFKE